MERLQSAEDQLFGARQANAALALQMEAEVAVLREELHAKEALLKEQLEARRGESRAASPIEWETRRGESRAVSPIEWEASPEEGTFEFVGRWVAVVEHASFSLTHTPSFRPPFVLSSSGLSSVYCMEPPPLPL